MSEILSSSSSISSQQKKLHLQALLKRRMEMRLHLMSLNQKIKDLQAEMKETETFLIRVDEDIDRLEDEVAMTGTVNDTGENDTGTGNTVLYTLSQSEDVVELPEEEEQQQQQQQFRRPIFSATQPDEFLPDPATQSPAAVATTWNKHAQASSSSTSTSSSSSANHYQPLQPSTFAKSSTVGVGQLNLVVAKAQSAAAPSSTTTTTTTTTNEKTNNSKKTNRTNVDTSGSSDCENNRNAVKMAPGTMRSETAAAAASAALTGRQGTLDNFFQPPRRTDTTVPQQPTAVVIDLCSGHDNNHQPHQPPPPIIPHSTRQQPPPLQHSQDHDPNNAAAYFREDSNFSWSKDVRQLLQNTFRLNQFRDHQKEIINATLSGQDVFVVMRTGGGKSLTYQLPALLEGRGPDAKVTFVVSPLLSLIQDQEDQMNQFAPGSAISFSSSLKGGNAEHARRWALVRDPRQGVCLVFITPEKISQSKKLQTELEKLAAQGRLGRFVIDECHCASQWGHDFRPDYTKLGVLKRHFPYVPCIAVTATASDKVRDDVCEILCLGNNYRFFRSSANRPNLRYSVRSKREGKEVIADMVAFIKEHHARHAGIVYTFSRKDADTVADNLCDFGVVARSYHSDVTPKNKELIHNSWMRNETQVVVATIAFGLGINKPDVRFVLHHTISKTLDAYYQESGRAGRDGKDADCVLYYNPKDVPRMLKMIHGTKGESLLWPMVRYAQASSHDSVCRAILMAHLGEPVVENMETLIRSYDGTYTERRDVGRHCQTAARLLDLKVRQGEKLTMPMLLKEWRSKAGNVPQCVKDFPPTEDNLTVEECERIIISLLLEYVFEPQIIWTAYDSIVYLAIGPVGPQLLNSVNPSIFIRLPKRDEKRPSAQDVQKKTKKTVTDEGGWLTSKPKASAKRKKPTAASKKKVAKKKPKTKKTKGAASKKVKKEPTKKVAAAGAVIDLYSDDDEQNEGLPAAKSEPDDDLWDDDDDGSSEDENEFEG